MRPAFVTPTESFEVAGFRIGGDAPCFVIAEAGVNHNGELELAKRLVDAAKECGADAVKFQSFDASKTVSDSAPKAAYQKETTDAEQSQLEMIRALELDAAAHAELVAHCKAREILFLSTPADRPSADMLKDLGVPLFKIGSGELTNLPFLAYVAQLGLPMIFSSGMGSLYEVLAATRAIGEAIESGAPPKLAILHCVSAYPAPVEQCNLQAMETIRSATRLPVGWSDHTLGNAVSFAAVAMGASLVERHLTLDRTLPGPDHEASLEPAEFSELVVGIRAVESARGDGEKRCQPVEEQLLAIARRSLHAARDLAAGDRLTEDDLEALRPGTGISPSEQQSVVGRRLARPVAARTMLSREDLE